MRPNLSYLDEVLFFDSGLERLQLCDAFEMYTD